MKWPAWSVDLFRRDGTAAVPALTDFAYDWDMSREVISGGSFTTMTDPGNVIGAWLRISVDGEYLGGDFPITACTPMFSPTGDSWRIEFMDGASKLQRAKLAGPVGYAAATPPVARARARLQKLGVPATIADNSQTLRTAKAWAASTTSELGLINELMSTVGHHPLWPSPTGLISARWPDPTRGPALRHFVEGEESLHLPQYPQDSDHLQVPNRLVVTSKGDANAPQLTAVARDEVTSPWSRAARGFWVDADPVQVDRPTQADLNDEAQRRLRDLQFTATTMTVHATLSPLLLQAIGAPVQVEASRPAVAGRWQLIGMSAAQGKLAVYKMRKVA